MSEISYFASRRDTIELACLLMREFGASIHEDNSPTKDPIVFSTENEVRSRMIATPEPRLWHVTSPRWSHASIEMGGPVTSKEGKPTWYVQQRHGGPAFIWLLPGERKDGERSFLRSGMFGDWATYYFGPGNVEQARPTAMSEAFKEISKQICRGAKRTRQKANGSVGPWMSADAYRLWEAGFSIAEELEPQGRTIALRR